MTSIKFLRLLHMSAAVASLKCQTYLCVFTCDVEFRYLHLRLGGVGFFEMKEDATDVLTDIENDGTIIYL